MYSVLCEGTMRAAASDVRRSWTAGKPPTLHLAAGRCGRLWLEHGRKALAWSVMGKWNLALVLFQGHLEVKLVCRDPISSSRTNDVNCQPRIRCFKKLLLFPSLHTLTNTTIRHFLHQHQHQIQQIHHNVSPL